MDEFLILSRYSPGRLLEACGAILAAGIEPGRPAADGRSTSFGVDTISLFCPITSGD